jgi:hypothetical protein
MRGIGTIDKAVLATGFFTAAGIAGLFLSGASWEERAPTALVYAVLVVNTWFSVRFFSRLPPIDRNELAIDGLLTVLYVALAFAIGRIIPFIAIATVLFFVAVGKYALLLPVLNLPRTLRRKMFIDALGGLLSLSALIGALLGYELKSAWAFALIFLVANGFLLLVQPMYRVFDSPGS